MTNSVLFLRPHQTAGGGYAFRAPPGRYYLTGLDSGSWSVRSAFYGNTNLAGGEIDVAAGSGGAPIRLVVNNQKGSLTGTVQMGATTSGWLYMLPRQPGLRLFYTNHLGNQGTFQQQLPAGSYRVIAVENQLQADLRDPRVMRELAARGKEVQVPASGEVRLDLTLTTPTPFSGSDPAAAGGDF